MTNLTPNSSWVHGFRYTPNGNLGEIEGLSVGTVEVLLRGGEKLVYADVPSWRVGLMMAHKSPGRAYNLHLKGRYEFAGTVERRMGERATLATLLEKSIADLELERTAVQVEWRA